jgi:hypothetical protein
MIQAQLGLIVENVLRILCISAERYIASCNRISTERRDSA